MKNPKHTKRIIYAWNKRWISRLTFVIDDYTYTHYAFIFFSCLNIWDIYDVSNCIYKREYRYITQINWNIITCSEHNSPRILIILWKRINYNCTYLRFIMSLVKFQMRSLILFLLLSEHFINLNALVSIIHGA